LVLREKEKREPQHQEQRTTAPRTKNHSTKNIKDKAQTMQNRPDSSGMVA